MIRRTLAFAAIGAALSSAPSAEGQTTLRVSVGSKGQEGDGDSAGVAMTPDGRFVAFASVAGNLVANDHNGVTDLFVRDTVTGTTTRVSVADDGSEGNGTSNQPAISADGRYVAFTSHADNLVPGDSNHWQDVFLHDCATRHTERVSVRSNGGQASEGSFMPALSADGQTIAFVSQAPDLVKGDTNLSWDVFVRDRAESTTQRVSVDSHGGEADSGSLHPALSGDGRRVAFASFADNLVPGDTNRVLDVFLHDRASGMTWRDSVGPGGVEGNDVSDRPSLSADGALLAFESYATNFVAHDGNGAADIFVRDVGGVLLLRASLGSFGEEADGDSGAPVLSAGGRMLAFRSSATNLVPGDTNEADDVFVRDLELDLTTRASVAEDGGQADGASDEPALDRTGRRVAFSSSATNLVAGDGNERSDLFVRERLLLEAQWSLYGTGLAGTLFEPTVTVDRPPRLNDTVKLAITNSSGYSTMTLLVSGPAKASIQTNRCGTLLVQVQSVTLIRVDAAGWSMDYPLPADESLCGLEIDLQALEGDPGAPDGVSFTKGLELILGF